MTSKRAALILTLALLAPPVAFAGSPTLERIKTSGVVRFAYRDHAEVTDRTIDSHVRRVRRKFAAVGGDPIETVHGLGYRIASCE